TPPDTEEIRKVTEAMRTDILKVDQYPEITLASKRITPSDGEYRIDAELTIVGQTRELSVEVRVEIGQDTLRAVAAFAVKQTDFVIKPFRGGPAGMVRVADRVAFDIEAVAVRDRYRPERLDRYSRAALSTCCCTSAIDPSSDAPAARLCPPPPNRCARSATSTSPMERKLTLIRPFAIWRNSRARRTPAMERGYSTIPSRSSAVAPWRCSASGGTVTHARPASGSTTSVCNTSVISRTRPSGAL